VNGIVIYTTVDDPNNNYGPYAQGMDPSLKFALTTIATCK
jgi:hypothetical protein